MQQRYYDPAIGRFLSNDPVSTNSNNGASFNRYNYANNNPYRFTDPDGRCVEDFCVGEAMVIGGAVGGFFGGAVYLASEDHLTWGGFAANVGTGAAVGAATAVLPVMAAARFVMPAAKITAAAGTAAAIGTAGSAARQQLTTGKVDATKAAIEGAANVAGMVAGAKIAPFAARLATTGSEAVPGVVRQSLTGRTFTIGGIPSTISTSQALKSTIQETTGASAAIAAERVGEKVEAQK